jgi:hypothetical protein
LDKGSALVDTVLEEVSSDQRRCAQARVDAFEQPRERGVV